MDINDFKMIRDFRLELKNYKKNNSSVKQQSIFPVSFFYKNGNLDKKERLLMACELAMQSMWGGDYSLVHIIFEHVINDITEYAQRNDPDFLFYLAQCYFYGIGVCENHQISMMLFEKAAAFGDPRAQHDFAATVEMNSESVDIDEETCEKAFTCLLKSAAGGYLNAQWRLAYWYLYGNQIVEPDIKFGIDHLRKAAEKDVDAALGILEDFIEKLYDDYDDEVQEYFPDLFGE